jgi:hypothetical protein
VRQDRQRDTSRGLSAIYRLALAAVLALAAIGCGGGPSSGAGADQPPLLFAGAAALPSAGMSAVAGAPPSAAGSAGAAALPSAGMNAVAGAPPSAAGSAGVASRSTSISVDPSSPLVLTPPCSATGWNFASGFLLDQSVDYVADLADSGGARIVYSESGSACASARDPSTCEASLAVIASFGRQLVTTSGDEVHFWPGSSALDLLGEIDTPSEALWVLVVEGYYLPCSSTVTAIDDGWAIELPSQQFECTLPSAMMSAPTTTVHMDRAGQVMLPDTGRCSLQRTPT